MKKKMFFYPKIYWVGSSREMFKWKSMLAPCAYHIAGDIWILMKKHNLKYELEMHVSVYVFALIQ